MQDVAGTELHAIHCMHASCAPEVDKTNRLLRSAILNPNGDAGFVLPRLTAEDKARIAERNHSEKVRIRAAKSLPRILKKYRWTRDDIVRESGLDVTGDCNDHFRLREPGQVKGTRLFNLASILAFIEKCEQGAADAAAKTTPEAAQ